MKKKLNFRSQKTCILKEITSRVYSSLSGLSLQGLLPGPVLGYSVKSKDRTEHYFAHTWISDILKASESPRVGVKPLYFKSNEL